MNSLSPVIVLVHGTFAQNAEWTKPDSSLCKYLLTRFPKATIHRFGWSGGNSHSERIAAGNCLSGLLLELSRGGIINNLTVIGHSHGGNVALYAMRDPAVLDLVDNLIFLSTPFFAVKERNLEELMSTVSRVVSMLLGGSTVSLCMLAYLLVLYKWASKEVYSTILFLIGFLALFGSVELVTDWYRRKLMDRLSRSLAKASEIHYQTIKTPPPACRWLSIYTKWDEALTWLSSLHLLSAVPYRLAKWLSFLVVVLGGPILLNWLLTGFFGYMTGTKETYLVWVRYMAMPYIALALVTAIVFLSSFVFARLIRGTRLGLGHENPLQSVGVSIVPRSLPLDSTELGSKVVISASAVHGFRHSASYLQPEAFKVIGDFLEGKTWPIGSSTTQPSRGHAAIGIFALTIAVFALVLVIDSFTRQRECFVRFFCT